MHFWILNSSFDISSKWLYCWVCHHVFPISEYPHGLDWILFQMALIIQICRKLGNSSDRLWHTVKRIFFWSSLSMLWWMAGASRIASRFCLRWHIKLILTLSCKAEVALAEIGDFFAQLFPLFGWPVSHCALFWDIFHSQYRIKGRAKTWNKIDLLIACKARII